MEEYVRLVTGDVRLIDEDLEVFDHEEIELPEGLELSVYKVGQSNKLIIIVHPQETSSESVTTSNINFFNGLKSYIENLLSAGYNVKEIILKPSTVPIPEEFKKWAERNNIKITNAYVLMKSTGSRVQENASSPQHRARRNMLPNNMGVISLKPLYDFIIKEFPNSDLMGKNPWPNKSPVNTSYKAAISRLEGWPVSLHTRGIYLWGYYDEMGIWHTIYLGKAAGTRGNIGIEGRIKKELDAERAFIFVQIYSRNQILRYQPSAYSNTWKKYLPNYRRAFRKRGTTFIFWHEVNSPSGLRLTDIENALIQLLMPRANRAGTSSNIKSTASNVAEALWKEFQVAINFCAKYDYAQKYPMILPSLVDWLDQ